MYLNVLKHSCYSSITTNWFSLMFEVYNTVQTILHCPSADIMAMLSVIPAGFCSWACKRRSWHGNQACGRGAGFCLWSSQCSEGHKSRQQTEAAGSSAQTSLCTWTRRTASTILNLSRCVSGTPIQHEWQWLQRNVSWVWILPKCLICAPPTL